MNKALLIILDGFGYSPKIEHNAIALSNTPFIDSLFNEYPSSLLETSGEAVGLPEGIMGNSEVGHLTIGTGRVIYQDLSLISKYGKEKSFETDPQIGKILSRNKALHLIGLMSDGGVHSHIEHWKYLIEQSLTRKSEQEIYLHFFMDGRDTAPTSGQSFIADMQEFISKFKTVKIASICGRFFAMDRDKRWDRVEKAYKLLKFGESESATYSSAKEAIEDAYKAGETDEFVKPRWIKEAKCIDKEDSVIFMNFRADRAREISLAFCGNDFNSFPRTEIMPEENWFTFTSYSEDFRFPVLFEKSIPRNSLGELVAKNAGTQLRIAETEKYAHVTYFLSGGREELFEGETRILCDSPKEVATYDLKPEMSAPEVTEKLMEAMREQGQDLIVVNYANGDMVGHTGNEQAAIDAVEALDACLAKLVPLALKKNYEILLSADHGNCEQMLDEETGEDFTQHTTNPVPLIWISAQAKGRSLKDGSLADIAPSLLHLMGISIPQEMTGNILMDSAESGKNG